MDLEILIDSAEEKAIKNYDGDNENNGGTDVIQR